MGRSRSASLFPFLFPSVPFVLLLLLLLFLKYTRTQTRATGVLSDSFFAHCLARSAGRSVGAFSFSSFSFAAFFQNISPPSGLLLFLRARALVPSIVPIRQPLRAFVSITLRYYLSVARLPTRATLMDKSSLQKQIESLRYQLRVEKAPLSKTLQE